MKRIFKLVLILTITLTMCLCVFSACASPDEQTNETQSQETNDETPNNGIRHYEIQLNKDNFEEFLEYKVEFYATITPRCDFYEITGVLTYAYYKDVVITFNAEYLRSNGLGGQIAYKGNYALKLNAAGHNSFYTNDNELLKAINCNKYDNMMISYNLTIIEVSGTVIFDI